MSTEPDAEVATKNFPSPQGQSANNTLPDLVTAVMITGRDPERRVLAGIAVTTFLGQTYPRKELVIINTGEPLRRPEPCVREICLDQGAKKLGELRNMGIEESEGDWVIQWDDDDWHHPERIAAQMKFSKRNGACVLGSQVRFSLVSGTGFVWTDKAGIEGTILHHRSVAHRYPRTAKSEDTVFYRLFARAVVVRGCPELYVRLYHGRNTWDEKHIMKNSREWPALDSRKIRLLERMVLPLYRGIASPSAVTRERSI